LTPRAEEVTPIRLEEPLAPPVAARRDPAWQSRSLRLGDYQDAVRAWAGRCDWLLVEGVGGLLCPITETETLADLAVWWGEPVVIVARLGLGTLNHTLLTIEAAQTRGLDVVGVVVNRSDPAPLSVADETNPAEMRRLLPCPVWGPIDFLASDATIPGAVVSMADAILERLAKS
jgi:dethiobiotin synthetase